ncbi:MAG: class II aldolase/adducin family protein [Patescibacteria group bacterium]
MPYHGVKFTTKMIDEEISKDPRIEELKFWCKKFHEKNFAPQYNGGSSGNLSFRLKDEEDSFVITASGLAMKDGLSDDCFVRVSSVDLEKGIVCAHGKMEPSSENMLHFAIYRKRKDVNAIFHGHSEEILSNAEKLNTVETREEESYGSIELVQSVLEVLGGNYFLVMKNHGFISLGETMEDAGKRALDMISLLV